MTSQSPRIYTYKITFEEVPYYYYGVHKETKYDEKYLGSPYKNKWCWDFYTPKKQILEVFEYSDEGWDEAIKVERRLIKSVLFSDKWCLNAGCGFMLPLERRREIGKKSGKYCVENKIGFHSFNQEQRKEVGRRMGTKNYKNKVGIHALTKEQRSENARRNNSQKWLCLETGFTANAGNLSQYQRARGIDTSQRMRIE